MRNLKADQKSSNGSALWKGFVAVVVVAMVGAAAYTVYNVMHKGAESGGSTLADGQAAVAVASAEIAAGGSAEGAYSIISVDESIVPENAVTASFDMSGGVLAIDVLPNTVLTQNMFVFPDLDQSADDTSRMISINYLSLDAGVAEGDYIDVRIKKYGTEEGFVYSDDVILAKKRVHAISGQEITLSLSEDEQLAIGIAAVDASMYGTNTQDKTAELYSTRYVNASQEKAVVTYSNEKLSALIDSNPNLIAEAQRDLAKQQAIEAQQTERKKLEMTDDTTVQLD